LTYSISTLKNKTKKITNLACDRDEEGIENRVERGGRGREGTILYLDPDALQKIIRFSESANEKFRFFEM
jgi:hypothetical protein